MHTALALYVIMEFAVDGDYSEATLSVDKSPAPVVLPTPVLPGIGGFCLQPAALRLIPPTTITQKALSMAVTCFTTARQLDITYAVPRWCGGKS